MGVKPAKRIGKTEREKEVLLGLIDYYLDTGKPVGSTTLKETGFDHLSSATIRNYFSKLEEEGYLYQPHASGGRIPTEKAFRFYASEYLENGIVPAETLKSIEKIKALESREIHTLIHKALDELSRITGCAAFISAPRFDRDFIVDIKVVPIDHERTLCIVVTDFGSIEPEILYTDQKLNLHAAKRIEGYLQARLMGQEIQSTLEPDEEALAQKFYNEIMVRFLVGTSNFTEEEILRTGFSNMLKHAEFLEPQVLSDSMALFENSIGLRHLLRDTTSHGKIRFWIGDDLFNFGAKSKQTSVVAMPYAIYKQFVGGFGVLGPMRLPYRELFGVLRALGEALTSCITKNLYKFKLTFRQPEKFSFGELNVPRIEQKLIPRIENKPTARKVEPLIGKSRKKVKK